MKRSEKISELASALGSAQGEIKDTIKTKEAYGYKYADLSSVLAEVRTVFSKHGLSFTQEVTATEKGISVKTLLIHTSGEWIEYLTIIPSISLKGTNDAQNAGAGITYARRYAISAIAGISSEEDTDAAEKNTPKNPPQTKTQPKATQKAEDKQRKEHDEIINLLEKLKLTYEEKLYKGSTWVGVTSDVDELTEARLLKEGFVFSDKSNKYVKKIGG